MEVLDQNTDTNPEVIENPSTDPQVTPENTDVTTDGGGSGENPENPPEYTPNFGFKYAVEGSKQVEDEISEIYRPLIKDPETEKQIRELHEKAYGLDFVKQDRDTLKEQFTNTQQQYQEQTKALQTVGAYIKHKDYGSVFDTLGIPREDVLKYALEQVQYQKMEPHQRAEFDQQNAERNRIAALELQNQEITQNYQQMAAQQREWEVDNYLMRQDVAETVNAFDQRAGQSGAFKAEVFRRGQMYAHQGQDVPVNQVVTELINLVGGAPAVAPGQGAQAQTQTAQTQKPVIPNISGKGTSPVKRVPKSIEDLRKIRAEMEAPS